MLTVQTSVAIKIYISVCLSKPASLPTFLLHSQMFLARVYCEEKAVFNDDERSLAAPVAIIYGVGIVIK